MTLSRRIRNWWRGYHQPATAGTMPICRCGHYHLLHLRDGCTALARDQWATVGPLSWTLWCRCRASRDEVRNA